jgi:hypothetical protein
MKRFIPLVVSMALIWAGCGGGKSSSTTTTVAVTISPTTASVAGGGTQQFTATVTGSTNTAVTWQVNGVPGGTALTGTISTTGLYTAPTVIPVGTTGVNVGVIAQADTTGNAVANAAVTLTVPTVTISIAPLSATVPAGGTVQFTPTVTSTDNNTAVTWSVNGCPVAANCGTVSSTGLYTAPLSPPQEAITVTATSVSNGTFTASAPISVQFGNASLSGRYVFLAMQPDNGSGSGFALRAGSFVADGAGHITSGIDDSNSSAGAVAATSLTGTYTVGADGRGTMTITDTASHTFSFALTSNTRGQMIGFDSGAATGLIRQQDQTAIAGVSGPFVFGVSGDNAGPAAAVGQLNFTGSLITGDEDLSTGVSQGISGSFTAPSAGRGTAVINTSTFAYYIIDASTLALIDVDATGARLAGTALAQSKSAFTAASLGSSSYFVTGNSVPGGKPYAQAGRFDTDGVSKLTGGVFDTNNAGNVTQNAAFPNTASYTLSTSAPTNGRGTISTGTSTFIFWLASPTQGFVLESDSGLVAEGTLFRQQVGIGAISGGYEFAVGGTSADGTTPQAIGGLLTIGGFGVLSGTEDLNLGNGNFQSGASISGNPSLVIALATGRATATVNGTLNNSLVSSVPYSFYLINSNRFIMFSTSLSSVLSGVGERQCSDCQF